MKRTLPTGLISILLTVLLLTGSSSITLGQNSLPVYLIIAPVDFKTALVPFIDLKTAQGFQTELALLSETGSSRDEIRGYIQDFSPRPKYVLLVGDTELIPSWNIKIEGMDPANCRMGVQEIKDLYYTTLEGVCDTTPDLILGRFPVQDELELSALINKYLVYEAAPADAAWRNKLSFISNVTGGFYSDTETVHNEVINTLTLPRAYSGTFTGDGAPTAGGDRLYPDTYSATKEDLLAAVNDGRAVVTYRGPGTATQWQWKLDAAFTTADVSSLSGPPVPLVFDMAPGSADYQAETSMADAWLLNPDSGALAYIATSFDLSFYNNANFEKYYWDNLIASPAAPASIGEALHATLVEMEERYYYDPIVLRRYREAYQILGDPSLKVVDCRCGRLESPYDTYSGKSGTEIQIPVTLTNPDLLGGSYTLSISGPPAFNPQLSPGTIILGGGETIPLDVSAQIPPVPIGASGNIVITASRGEISTSLVLHVQAEIQRVYLPLVQR